MAGIPDHPGDTGRWIILGLGNPGDDYAGTYHNAGFRVVDILARRWGLRIDAKAGEARIAESPDAVLVKPWTYMNRVGRVLPALFERFGPGGRLLVVSDDLALPIGRIRVRERGSAGGHNGLKSISSACGSDEYLRVRVGIGGDDAAAGEGAPRRNTRDYVLSPVPRKQRTILGRSEMMAADAVEHVLAHGAADAMSKFNGRDAREETNEA